MVSTPMFSRRRHVLAYCTSAVSCSKSTCNSELPTHTEHEVEKYTIMAIMASEAGSKNMQVGNEKVICNKLWPN